MEALLTNISDPFVLTVLVPILVFLAKKIIPVIPKAALPILAGALGPAIDQSVAYLASVDGHGMIAMLAGLAGVGIREVQDQLRSWWASRSPT